MGVDLSIVIVNWNGRGFLPDCLRSIVESKPKVSYEIVVVDNASSDGSVDWMKSAEARELLGVARFRLIESGENLGFGRANNLAFEQTDSKYVFVLNPDSRLIAGSLDRLIETLELKDTIGMTAPRLLNRDRKIAASVIPFHPTPISIIVEEFKLYKVLPRSFIQHWLFGQHWGYDVRRPVPIVAGAAMMCKREMINDVGGFDKDTFMYGEDLEWCVRIYREGWSIYFEPEVEILHLGGKSTEQLWSSELTVALQEQAMIRFHRKCFSRPLNLTNSVTKMFVMSVHFVRWKLLKRNTEILSKLIKMHMRNCKELISGRKIEVL